MGKPFTLIFLVVSLLVVFPIQVYAQINKPKKISENITSILRLIEQKKIRPENAREKNISKLSNPLLHIRNDGRIQIYIYMHSFGEEELAELLDLDVEIEISNKKYAIVQGWAPFDRIEEISSLSFVRLVASPRYSSTRSGSVVTEGDALLKADQLRELGLDGSSVKIGVISDGANDRADAQATGDLPSNITVYGTCTPRSFNGPQCDPGRTCNEGTAMLEIIHDIAPGARLAVGSVNTSLEFIQRLDDLVYSFGADVIVDDLGFLNEPYFEDGQVAQEVADVSDQVIYISAAGNSAIGHYEAEYKSGISGGYDLHNFGQAAGGATDFSMNVSINPSEFIIAFLQWNDQFGASANDYDLWLVNVAETDLLCPTCSGEEPQYGFQNPFEYVCYYNNTSNVVAGKLGIHKFSGSNKRLEMFVLGGSVEEYNVPDGSIYGHTAIPNVLAIGAINAGDPGVDTIEFYSSRGPSRIDFPTLQIRQKPDLAAIDGVSVTGTGGFPSIFFGTSAAAPHVAGIAALLKQQVPLATPGMVRSALKSGAFDLGTAGIDNTFGAGRVDALAAFTEIAPDSDNDEIIDSNDNCPTIPNTNQLDTDADGLGDVCDPDDDNDGVPDSSDAFPLNPNESADTDSDGYGDNSDNCPTIPNTNQLDTDIDGLGDVCDPDDDNDGVPDSSDAFPSNPSESVDTDGDGIGDNFENTYGLNPLDNNDAGLDPDGDGLTNLEEFEAGRNPFFDERKEVTIIDAFLLGDSDTDGDGIPDNTDTDDDGDGIPDDFELTHGLNPLYAGDANQDKDADGLINLEEYIHGTDIDVADSDGDGEVDGAEVVQGRNPLFDERIIIPVINSILLGE